MNGVHAGCTVCLLKPGIARARALASGRRRQRALCSFYTGGEVACFRARPNETADSDPADVVQARPADLGLVSAAAVGADFACAIVSSTSLVRCWRGAYEDPSPSGWRVPEDLGKVRALAAGQRHACAITERRGLRCWGGLRDTGSAIEVPEDIARGDRNSWDPIVKAVACASGSTCVLVSPFWEGRATLKCFGDPSYSAYWPTADEWDTPLAIWGLETGYCVQWAVAGLACTGNVSVPQAQAALTGAKAAAMCKIDTSAAAAAVMGDGGRVWAWGLNIWSGYVPEGLGPAATNTPAAMASSSEHVCAIQVARGGLESEPSFWGSPPQVSNVRCWGDRWDANPPAAPAGLGAAMSLAQGFTKSHTCAILRPCRENTRFNPATYSCEIPR